MSLIAQLESVQEQVDKNFSGLNPEQLNWKPEPGKWSIGQCLDHLITANKTYLPIFDKVLNGDYKPGLLQRLNPFKKIFGPMMVKSLGPVPTKKFTAPKIFEPSSSNTRSSIVRDFLSHQQDMKNYYQRLEELEGSKIVISSPVNSFITYSLEDALKIITGHEQRHLNQALNVLNHPNFPRS